MSAVGSEMGDVESGCWPQKIQLPNLMYLCNFSFQLFIRHEQNSFSSDGLRHKFIQFIKSCCVIGKKKGFF